ncbi:MAG: hypothetical protein HY399_04280 [Elusimicrobia bacterium]|nr:hypothetical protein [Elusimicrobiota bacterium]
MMRAMIFFVAGIPWVSALAEESLPDFNQQGESFQTQIPTTSQEQLEKLRQWIQVAEDGAQLLPARVQAVNEVDYLGFHLFREEDRQEALEGLRRVVWPGALFQPRFFGALPYYIPTGQEPPEDLKVHALRAMSNILRRSQPGYRYAMDWDENTVLGLLLEYGDPTAIQLNSTRVRRETVFVLYRYLQYRGADYIRRETYQQVIECMLKAAEQIVPVRTSHPNQDFQSFVVRVLHVLTLQNPQEPHLSQALQNIAERAQDLDIRSFAKRNLRQRPL